MKRRDLFLAGAAGAGGLAALGYGGTIGAGALEACGRTIPERNARAEPFERLGELFLASATPTEHLELKGAVAAIASERESGREAALAKHATDLASKARGDFERGDTFTCDGWVVSRSEAKACALMVIARRAIA